MLVWVRAESLHLALIHGVCVVEVRETDEHWGSVPAHRQVHEPAGHTLAVAVAGVSGIQCVIDMEDKTLES